MNRTQGSIKSSKEFSLASKIASLIYKGLKPLSGTLSDDKFRYRLNAQVHNALRSAAPAINGQRKFENGDIALIELAEFNSHTKLSKLLVTPPVAHIEPTEQLTLEFRKAANLFAHYPADAKTAVVELLICNLSIKTLNGKFTRSEKLLIPLQQKIFHGGTLEVPLDAVENKIILIALGVYFLTAKGEIMQNRKYYAGRIIKAINIKDGAVVEFIKPEEKKKPAVREEKRISWKLGKK